MKCKNIECDKETNGNIYCSLSCRSFFVNKYMRNYDKYSDTCKENRNKKEIEYLQNPKKCKYCESVIPFENKSNTYCNSSCMATYTNKNKFVTWNDNIRKGICEYLIKKGIRKEGLDAFASAWA